MDAGQAGALARERRTGEERAQDGPVPAVPGQRRQGLPTTRRRGVTCRIKGCREGCKLPLMVNLVPRL